MRSEKSLAETVAPKNPAMLADMPSRSVAQATTLEKPMSLPPIDRKTKSRLRWNLLPGHTSCRLRISGFSAQSSRISRKSCASRLPPEMSFDPGEAEFSGSLTRDT